MLAEVWAFACGKVSGGKVSELPTLFPVSRKEDSGDWPKFFECKGIGLHALRIESNFVDPVPRMDRVRAGREE